mmetsp:Transcript_25076/g.68916  ORF Transcript_25076/g.68916 Transcript_25076/m.68916 type:complete len:129 (-) Transcript_25076:701-1087(-)
MLDRAELLHFLQDLDLIGRGDPPEILFAIFSGCSQQLTLDLFKRALMRAALILAPDNLDGTENAEQAQPEQKVMWLLRTLADKGKRVKLPVLDLRRRIETLQALEKIGEITLEFSNVKPPSNEIKAES